MPVFVKKGHPLLGKEPPEELPSSAREFWRTRRLKACDGAVTLTGAERDAGFFRFFWFAEEKHLHAHGTWIAPTWRRVSVAFDLWAFAIRRKKPKKVSVWVTSRGGKKLIAALRGAFPEVKWIVEEP